MELDGNLGKLHEREQVARASGTRKPASADLRFTVR